jgi:hypothetical protein
VAALADHPDVAEVEVDIGDLVVGHLRAAKALLDPQQHDQPSPFVRARREQPADRFGRQGPGRYRGVFTWGRSGAMVDSQVVGAASHVVNPRTADSRPGAVQAPNVRGCSTQRLDVSERRSAPVLRVRSRTDQTIGSGEIAEGSSEVKG